MDRGRILLWADNPSWSEPEGTRRAVLSELAALWVNRTGGIKRLCRESYRQTLNNKLPSSEDALYFRNLLSSWDLWFGEYLGDIAGVIMGTWLELKFLIAGEWLYPDHTIILELETVVEHC